MKYPLLVFLPLIFILFSLSGNGQTANLKVVVSQINEIKGKIMVGVFDNALDFKSKKNPVDGVEILVKDSIVSCVFSNLVFQRYAIAVYHDENGDGILNTKKLGIPREGVGFSSKVASKLHQPIFPEASFLLKNDTTISIRIYYNKSK